MTSGSTAPEPRVPVGPEDCGRGPSRDLAGSPDRVSTDIPFWVRGSVGARSMVIALMVVLLGLMSNGRSIERMFDLYRISAGLPRAFAHLFDVVSM